MVTTWLLSDKLEVLSASRFGGDAGWLNRRRLAGEMKVEEKTGGLPPVALQNLAPNSDAGQCVLHG